MTTLKAYHNDPAVKRKYMRRVAAHRKADELVQGTGWESNGVTRGCAVGCTFDAYDHSRGPVEIGVPEVLMRLEDAIFEGLPKTDALKWPTQFLSAIPVGADLSLVWPKFAVWMLTDEKHGVIRHAGERLDVRDSIEGVAALYRRWIDTGKQPSKADCDKAARAARAARAAAWAAWAAEEAARAAWAWEAAWAAWAAARAAEEAAARAAFWRASRDELLRLLKGRLGARP